MLSPGLGLKSVVGLLLILVIEQCVSTSPVVQKVFDLVESLRNRTKPVAEAEAEVSDRPVGFSPESLFRIVNGRIVRKNSYPFLASLREGGFHFCGGTLISPEWVVTAAHCVYQTTGHVVSPEEVVLNSNTLEGSKNRVVRGVLETVVHPEFDIYTIEHDIALIRLSEPVKNVEPARIFPKERYKTGTRLTAIGFGVTDFLSRDPSPLLRRAYVPLLSANVCTLSYSPTLIHEESNLCAGHLSGGKADACSGDSGGPLFVKRRNKIHLVGVTSWGEGCATAGKPGVYANVSYYHDWIVETGVSLPVEMTKKERRAYKRQQRANKRAKKKYLKRYKKYQRRIALCRKQSPSGCRRKKKKCLPDKIDSFGNNIDVCIPKMKEPTKPSFMQNENI